MRTAIVLIALCCILHLIVAHYHLPIPGPAIDLVGNVTVADAALAAWRARKGPLAAGTHQ
jgi:hypothetical protein